MERHFFDEHAQAIAKRQYLQPGDGDILGMFRRVAREIARPERPEERAFWEEKFYELMSTKRFSPGGRILAGAGTAHGNLLNCFVQEPPRTLRRASPASWRWPRSWPWSPRWGAGTG